MRTEFLYEGVEMSPMIEILCKSQGSSCRKNVLVVE